jgi:phosphatidylserine/phosphatidylglycerophosphate/cardiolipin synthase-like enzyme
MTRAPAAPVAVLALALASGAFDIIPNENSISLAYGSEDARIEIHYSPAERLDAIDAGLISSAKASIDLAAYTLTDWAVIDALKAAEARSVAIRIVVDPRERIDADRLASLVAQVRTKRGEPLMHLKGYAIDVAILRTGSANFSFSGETAQHNDLVVIRDASAAARFDTTFERIWDASE